MFTYLIFKRLISSNFEKTSSGYIYRRRRDLPGILITEDERVEILSEFRRQYWRFWLFLSGGIVTAIIAIAAAATAFSLSENSIEIASYVLFTVLIIFILRQIIEWLRLPDKTFADRPKIMSEFPTISWFTGFKEMSRQRSWLVHTVFIIINGAISWILIPKLLSVTIVHWFFFTLFSASFLLSIYGAIYKAGQKSE